MKLVDCKSALTPAVVIAPTGFAMSFCDSVTPLFRDSVTAKLKCILLYNFYVCGPTSMKLILELVSKVSKV